MKSCRNCKSGSIEKKTEVSRSGRFKIIRTYSCSDCKYSETLINGKITVIADPLYFEEIQMPVLPERMRRGAKEFGMTEEEYRIEYLNELKIMQYEERL